MRKDIVNAHCDGPCGIYDHASARIAAEAVLSMTKKMLDLKAPESGDSEAMAHYVNTMSRYASSATENSARPRGPLTTTTFELCCTAQGSDVPSYFEVAITSPS